MRFRKIALALFACMALGAFAANAAQAQWTTENGSFSGSKEVSCKKHGTENLTLIGTIATLTLKLDVTGIECEEATIQTGTGMDTDHSEGYLNFTGVTVTEPPSCMVPGEHITTKHLTDRVIMDETGGSTTTFDTFFTDNGEPFVEIELTGAECPLAGVNIPVKGTACGESVHTSSGSLVAN